MSSTFSGIIIISPPLTEREWEKITSLPSMVGPMPFWIEYDAICTDDGCLEYTAEFPEWKRQASDALGFLQGSGRSLRGVILRESEDGVEFVKAQGD